MTASLSSSTNADHGPLPPPHRLSPQEAALRGASLAFQKQQKQQQQQQPPRPDRDPSSTAVQRKPSLTPSQLSSSRQHHTTDLSAAGGISRQNTGSSSLLGDAAERERERQALFLPSSDSSLLGGNNNGKSTEVKSASFIAATLAASRSASPGTGAVACDHGASTRAWKGSPLRQPVDASPRRGSASADNLATDTTSLPPTTSLISMFENKREPAAADPARRNPDRHVAKKPRRPSTPEEKPIVEPLDLNTGRVQPRNEPLPRSSLEDANPPAGRDKPKSKPKPGKKPKAIITERAVVTPPPPPSMASSAHTEIVSPKPRRPEVPPRLEVTTPSNFQDEFSGAPTKKAKPKPPTSKPGRGTVGGHKEPPPSASKPPGTPRRSHIASSDGQDESKPRAPVGKEEARPATGDSKSSNDSFVSASSTPTRDETDSIRTIEPPASTASTPRLRPTQFLSAQPSTASLPIRRTPTGSSQLPIDSLSDAIVAGSLASARHTPVLVASTSRTPPPPPPPSRRKGGGGVVAKHKTGSRKSSPHRMRKTMRQPASKSDDEEARRPHHKKGLNSKKHAHHEGSRSRWRDEITEREKKRYEAVWASNRGLFLVEMLQQQQQLHGATGGSNSRRPSPPVRNEGYEAASEHVANVVVRDLWSRSRLPEAELAEVWDLVYGHGPRGPLVHAALDKQEFVVGMWLVDQRLRGRKIPPRVSVSVWDSAKGLRVLAPGIGGGGGHGHGHNKKG